MRKLMRMFDNDTYTSTYIIHFATSCECVDPTHIHLYGYMYTYIHKQRRSNACL